MTLTFNSRFIPLIFSSAFLNACLAPATPDADGEHSGDFASDYQPVGTQPATDQCAPAPAAQSSEGDTQYFLYATARTWSEANDDCIAMGGRLAIPVDGARNDAINSLQSGPGVFIGVSQMTGQSSPDAGWLTVEGDALDYLGWQAGEPNDAPGPSENGQQDCGLMNASDGTWKDAPCDANRQYVCEFGESPVVCGGGASCAIAAGASDYRCQCPTGQTYDVDNHACYGGPLTVRVHELELEHAGRDVFTNFPIQGTIGLRSNGSPNRVHISLGLMERPVNGANATDEELAALRSCVVANGELILAGDDSLQHLTVRGIVPPECLDGDPQMSANVFVLIDATEDATTEEDKYVVFNQREASTPLGQACTTTDLATGQPVTGCVIDVTVKPSPGLDIALVNAKPVSSVGVLDPDGQHSDTPAGPGEAARPLIAVDLSVAAFGRDYDDSGAANLPGTVDFRYEIKADPDPSQIGWRLLDANPLAQHAPLDAIVPGEHLQFDARLHPNPGFRNLTAPGGAWAGVQNFKVRACALVPFGEHGDPTAGGGGANGASNNCREFPITVVPGDHSSSMASSYSASGSYSKSWGSSSTLKLTLAAASANEFSVSDGASTENYAKATMGGFFGSFDMVHGWANGYAEYTSAGVDGGLKVFGVSLASYANDVDVNVSWSKEKCLTYSYGIVITSVDLSGCFGINAGLDVDIDASNTAVSANVRPYASASLTAEASLNLTLYRASLSATVTILGLNTVGGDGVTATLSFTKPSSSQMVIGFDTLLKMRISTLDGSIDLTVDENELNWCKKKVWGVKVKYPCWKWDTLAEYTLFSYNGYSFTSTILDRSLGSYTLNL